MANFYKDSHGVSWGVMMQEKRMSCGPACVAMTEVYSKSDVEAGMEAKAREISQRYAGRFEEDTGSTLPNLASILRERGVPCYDAGDVGGGGVWAYLDAYAKDATPAICHVSWPKGGHFIVCIHVYKDDHRCVFLDPFYGLVEVVGEKLPTYVVQDPTGEFPPVAIGKLSGWLLITKASK